MMRRPLIAALLTVCAAAAAAEQTITAADTHVARMGRTVAEPDGVVRFGYAGVTLLLNVDGTRLAVDAAGGSRSLVDVIVDGKPAGTLRLAHVAFDDSADRLANFRDWLAGRKVIHFSDFE